MHSTEFTRLAQAADNNGWIIRAFAEIPPSPGTYPSAWCVIERDTPTFEGMEYCVGMGVLPSDGAGDSDEPWFTWVTYDLTRERAQQLLEEKMQHELRIAG